MQRKIGRPGIAALLLCLMMTALLSAAALAEKSDSALEYIIEGYTGEYDGDGHTISLRNIRLIISLCEITNRLKAA